MLFLFLFYIQEINNLTLIIVCIPTCFLPMLLEIFIQNNIYRLVNGVLNNGFYQI